MSVEYRVESEWPNVLCRRIRNDEGLQDEMWSVVDQAWIPSETACAVNCGFESSRDVSEEEAMRIVNGEG